MSILKKYAVCIFIMVATTIGYSKGQEKNLETDFSFPEYNNTVLPGDSARHIGNKYSVNIGYSYPLILNSKYLFGSFHSQSFAFDFLHWVGINRIINLGFGAGIQFSNHYWSFENEITKVGHRPAIICTTYKFKFTDIYIPIQAKFLFNSKAIKTCATGVKIGYIVNSDFKENSHSALNKSEIDKLFIESNLSIAMFYFHCGRASFSLQPYWNYRFYLSNKNELQKNYSSLGISLNSNF